MISKLKKKMNFDKTKKKSNHEKAQFMTKTQFMTIL